MEAEGGQRYFAFLDYLGTRALYAQGADAAPLIVDRRMELEHGIHITLQPHIANREVEVGVFSDTVLVAGPMLGPVLDAAARLLHFSFMKSLRRNKPSDIRLLRGGLTKGEELRSGYLKSGPGVSVIPFFDTSLAFAYELEATRRGSRLFLGSQIVDEPQHSSCSPYFSKPATLPGFGNATAAASEFLWPAYVHRENTSKLSAELTQAIALWESASQSIKSPNRYRETIYHFDETIKLFIRSHLVISDDNPRLLDQLTSYLPSVDHEDPARIRYLWGIWFQIALVLVQSSRASEFQSKLTTMRHVLEKRDYWDKFVAEADHEIYRPIKAAIGSLF